MAYLITADGAKTKIEGELTLEIMKKVVGGYIEIAPTKNNMYIVSNENGIDLNLPINEVATNMLPETMLPWAYNVIRGDVVLASKNEID